MATRRKSGLTVRHKRVSNGSNRVQPEPPNKEEEPKMNNEEMMKALTRSARKALRLYYNATGDNRAIGGQIEVGDIVNEAYLQLDKVTPSEVIGYTPEGVALYWYGDDETGHEVTQYAVIKWAVANAMRACGLRRDTENPTHEELNAEKHAHALAPSVAPVRGALKSDDVEAVSAGLRLALSELPRDKAEALLAGIEAFKGSDAVREFDAVGVARAVMLEHLTANGLGINKARAELSTLAGEVLGSVNATRSAFTA